VQRPPIDPQRDALPRNCAGGSPSALHGHVPSHRGYRQPVLETITFSGGCVLAGFSTPPYSAVSEQSAWLQAGARPPGWNAGGDHRQRLLMARVNILRWSTTRIMATGNVPPPEGESSVRRRAAPGHWEHRRFARGVKAPLKVLRAALEFGRPRFARLGAVLEPTATRSRCLTRSRSRQAPRPNADHQPMPQRLTRTARNSPSITITVRRRLGRSTRCRRQWFCVGILLSTKRAVIPRVEVGDTVHVDADDPSGNRVLGI